MGGPWNNTLKFCNNPLILWICLIQAFPLDNTVFYKKAFLPPIAFYKLDKGSFHLRMRLEEAPKLALFLLYKLEDGSLLLGMRLEEVPKLPYIIPSGFLAIIKSHSTWILPYHYWTEMVEWGLDLMSQESLQNLRRSFQEPPTG